MERLPNEKEYLEPRHAVQRRHSWDEAQGAVEDMHAEGPAGDAHDQFVKCLGGDVEARGGHQDSVRAHLKKIGCEVVDNRQETCCVDKSIQVRVKPEPKPDYPM
jgi:hypothetical protein